MKVDKMKSSVEINGKTFIKSTKSPYGKFCVGVCKENDSVLVTNTKENGEQICTFSLDEWRAFIAGVKNNEFDY